MLPCTILYYAVQYCIVPSSLRRALVVAAAVQDGVELPFENVLDYEAFAIRISERNIPRMVNILKVRPRHSTRCYSATVLQYYSTTVL